MIVGNFLDSEDVIRVGRSMKTKPIGSKSQGKGFFLGKETLLCTLQHLK